MAKAGGTPRGITLVGDEIPSRLTGEPRAAGSAHSFRTRGGSFNTRDGKKILTNMTMADVFSEWRERAAAHQASCFRASHGMRHDPVTGTYY